MNNRCEEARFLQTIGKLKDRKKGEMKNTFPYSTPANKNSNHNNNQRRENSTRQQNSQTMNVVIC